MIWINRPNLKIVRKKERERARRRGRDIIPLNRENRGVSERENGRERETK